MKAEIVDAGDGCFRLRIYDDDGRLARDPIFRNDHADAIHAALTEWKQKREAKPNEPKLRPFDSAKEFMQSGIAFIYHDCGWRTGFSVHEAVVVVRGERTGRFTYNFNTCQPPKCRNAAGEDVPFGVLEP